MNDHDRTRIPHRATLTLVGWARKWKNPEGEGGLQVNGCRFKLPEEAADRFDGLRIRLIGYPKTDPNGCLRKLEARPSNIRRAKAEERNQSSFEIIGHLLRRDLSEGRIKIEVAPSLARIRPFEMFAVLPPSIGRTLDPARPFCRARGSAMKISGKVHLICEEVEEVESSTPERWGSFEALRQMAAERRAKRRSKDEEDRDEASGNEIGEDPAAANAEGAAPEAA